MEAWSAPGFDAGAVRGGDADPAACRPASGLPGPRLGQSGEPAWIVDLPSAAELPAGSTSPASVGLEAAFGFPITSAGGTLGVMEFFDARVPRRPDGELLATMASLGSQIGQFVVRRRAEAQVRESDERKRAILDAALDCVITVDENGAVLEFNPAAERTFGYRAAEAIGADMAELIVPPSLRDAPPRRLRALRRDQEEPTCSASASR